ncbi:MAG: type I-U CRISPR-associated protein Csb2 [Acidobacteriota bacterium]|nr:type I-U CRISPR-associated protein Csb2 [Acidobacteriota bacterium]
MRSQILAATGKPPTQRTVEKQLDKALKSAGRQAHTLPERLVDALALDTADYQDRGWSRPPAAREIVYARASEAAPRVVARAAGRSAARAEGDQPTVARFLLAGRPLPRIEDAVRIGELMRRAALAQFGWRRDDARGRSIPLAPWEISGRDADGRPRRDPTHRHAFWLPEDADGDGWIDHVAVFIAGGMHPDIQARLDRITRLWLAGTQRSEDIDAEPGAVKEWRLALEGFGRPADFAGGARIFGTSRRWRSVTPFLASGHLKAAGYAGEVRRLLRRRGLDATGVRVDELKAIEVGGTPRRAIHFHRFRSRGREIQPDAAGTLLEITLRQPLAGPLALGYGSHFGLGLFAAIE